jgi:hypothetical protein
MMRRTVLVTRQMSRLRVPRDHEMPKRTDLFKEWPMSAGCDDAITDATMLGSTATSNFAKMSACVAASPNNRS